MGQLDAATLSAALDKEADAKVRAAAIRLTEPLLRTAEKDALVPKLLQQVTHKNLDVQIQLALTLGQVFDPGAEAAMAKIATVHLGNAVVRDALLTGLGGRELEMLRLLVSDKEWQTRTAEREQFLGALARCVTVQGRSERVNQLLALIGAATTPSWQQVALLNGMPPAPIAAKKGSPPMRVKQIRVPAEPPAFAALAKLNNPAVRQSSRSSTRFSSGPANPACPPRNPCAPSPLTSRRVSPMARRSTTSPARRAISPTASARKASLRRWPTPNGSREKPNASRASSSTACAAPSPCSARNTKWTCPASAAPSTTNRSPRSPPTSGANGITPTTPGQSLRHPNPPGHRQARRSLDRS